MARVTGLLWASLGLGLVAGCVAEEPPAERGPEADRWPDGYGRLFGTVRSTDGRLLVEALVGTWSAHAGGFAEFTKSNATGAYELLLREGWRLIRYDAADHEVHETRLGVDAGTSLRFDVVLVPIS